MYGSKHKDSAQNIRYTGEQNLLANPYIFQATAMSEPASNPGQRLRNFAVALTAIALAVALFLGFQTQKSPNSLPQLAASATPLDVARANGKPTLMEFYADWCTTCQAMAGEMFDLREAYGDRANFVMLNVDNTKWLPEMSQYRVDGIPHFVYLNPEGEATAEAVGEIPRAYMEANLVALIDGTPVPYARKMGKASKVNAAIAPAENTDPRNHGG